MKNCKEEDCFERRRWRRVRVYKQCNIDIPLKRVLKKRRRVHSSIINHIIKATLSS